VATFSGLSLNPASTTAYTLTATSNSLTPATTTPITATTPVAATQLAVTTEPPSSVPAGSAFTLTVSAETSTGQIDTTYTGPVTVAITSGTGPANGALGGTKTVNAVNGVATFSNLTLSPASTTTYTLTATSDSLFPATTTPITVTSSTLPTTVTVSASPTSSAFGKPVTLTSTVTSPGSPTQPTGTVTFLVNAAPIGTAPLVNGTATFTTSTLPAGSPAITASFAGNGNFSSGTSATPAVVTVSQATPTVALLSSANPSTAGQSVTFTATVTGPSNTSPPTGTVTFKNGTTTLGTAPLTNGVATFSTSTLPVGAQTITASYSGDANFLAGTPATLTQQVNAAVAAAPTVTNLQRFGFHNQPTLLVLTFSSALDSTRAENTANYTVTLGSQQFPVTAAVYNPTSHTVTLMFSQLLNIHRQYTITVNGMAPNGLTSATGVLLDGANNGKPGSNFVLTFGSAILAGPASAAGLNMALVRQLSHHKISAHAVDVLLARGELHIQRHGHR
jgi:hypothetical protein